MIAGLISADGPTSRLTSGAAPDFSLETTDGGRVSLASLQGRPALLYFNEGVGCDSCFTQLAKIEEERDIDGHLGTMPAARLGVDRVGVTSPRRWVT